MTRTKKRLRTWEVREHTEENSYALMRDADEEPEDSKDSEVRHPKVWGDAAQL